MKKSRQTIAYYKLKSPYDHYIFKRSPLLVRLLKLPSLAGINLERSNFLQRSTLSIDTAFWHPCWILRPHRNASFLWRDVTIFEIKFWTAFVLLEVSLLLQLCFFWYRITLRASYIMLCCARVVFSICYTVTGFVYELAHSATAFCAIATCSGHENETFSTSIHQDRHNLKICNSKLPFAIE